MAKIIYHYGLSKWDMRNGVINTAEWIIFPHNQAEYQNSCNILSEFYSEIYGIKNGSDVTEI